MERILQSKFWLEEFIEGFTEFYRVLPACNGAIFVNANAAEYGT